MALSKTDQRRIAFLSLFSSHEADYDAATGTLEQMEEDGFFESGGGSGNSRSSGRSRDSGGRGSGSRSKSRGRSGTQGNPDWREDAITDKQFDRVLELAGNNYSDSDIEAMTKGQASDIIDDLG